MKNGEDLPTHSFENPSCFLPPSREKGKRQLYAFFSRISLSSFFYIFTSLFVFTPSAAFPPVCGPRGSSIN